MESLIAIIALVVSGLTLIYGIILSKRQNDEKNNKLSVEERIGRLEDALDECEKERNRLIEENAHLQNKLTLEGLS